MWQIVDKNMNGSIDLKEFEAFLNEGRKKKIVAGDDENGKEKEKKKKNNKKRQAKRVVEPVTESEMSLWRVFVYYSMQGEITRPAVMTICQMMRLLRDAGLLPSLSSIENKNSDTIKKKMFDTPTSKKKKKKKNGKEKK